VARDSIILTGAVLTAVRAAADRVRAAGGYLTAASIAIAAIEHGIEAAERAALDDIKRRSRIKES